MSGQSVRALFESIWTPQALWAVAPLMVLGVGMLAVLLGGVLSSSRALRRGLMATTLALAFVAQVHLLRQPELGLVLDGTLRSDRWSGMWGLLFLAATAIAWLFSLDAYKDEGAFKLEHDALVLLVPMGMLLMAGAQDLIVFFVGLELLSVPLYALAAFHRNRPGSVEAGLKYFLLGAFSAGLFLYGAALLYASTGTVSLEALRAVNLAGEGQGLARTGVALLMAGLLFKLGVFPFHLWIPDVYEGSPTPITALMAMGTKAAAMAFLLNAMFLLPGSSADALAALALLTMAAGNLAALVQSDLKRMLAYSAIAHAGTLLLVLAGAMVGDPQPGGPWRAAIYYMAAYVFTAGGAFGLISLLERDGGRLTRVDSLRGLAGRRPWVAAAMTLFLLSLGGIPATGGFLAKWMVFALAVRADMLAVAVIGILLSVVALAYYLRLVVAMYMQPELEGVETQPRVSRASVMPAALATGVCSLAVLALGVLPGWFLDQLR